MTRDEANKWLESLYGKKRTNPYEFGMRGETPAPQPEKKPVKPIIQFPASERKDAKS